MSESFCLFACLFVLFLFFWGLWEGRYDIGGVWRSYLDELMRIGSRRLASCMIG